MSESKELLEATIKGLQEKINNLNDELRSKEKELEDVNKPEMEAWMYDEIHGLVEDGIGEFDFSNTDNYDFDFELDYDGRVNVCSMEFNDADYVKEPILKLIENKFNIINDTEDETNE